MNPYHYNLTLNKNILSQIHLIDLTHQALYISNTVDSRVWVDFPHNGMTQCCFLRFHKTLSLPRK